MTCLHDGIIHYTSPLACAQCGQTLTDVDLAVMRKRAAQKIEDLFIAICKNARIDVVRFDEATSMHYAVTRNGISMSFRPLDSDGTFEAAMQVFRVVCEEQDHVSPVTLCDFIAEITMLWKVANPSPHPRASILSRYARRTLIAPGPRIDVSTGQPVTTDEPSAPNPA